MQPLEWPTQPAGPKRKERFGLDDQDIEPSLTQGNMLMRPEIDGGGVPI
jgi:hypothetical protein